MVPSLGRKMTSLLYSRVHVLREVESVSSQRTAHAALFDLNCCGDTRYSSKTRCLYCMIEVQFEVHLKYLRYFERAVGGKSNKLLFMSRVFALFLLRVSSFVNNVHCCLERIFDIHTATQTLWKRGEMRGARISTTSVFSCI